jgi:pimeloyl-ACP methyl ester carboxylesterase
MKQRSLMALGARGFHSIAYVEWGEPDRPAVICAHGLTRNGRDFDALAGALAGQRRVVCPDLPGRGRSDWLADPAEYGYPRYTTDMTALIARLDVDSVDWVGTSMGGLVGLMLAAMPGSPIRRLVLNDIGPFIPRAALERLGRYVGQDPVFAGEAELEAYLRRTYAPFGPLEDEDWRHFATHSQRRDAEGRLRLAYDPAIGRIFSGELRDVDLWAVWECVSCPVLVLRGAQSDLLTADTAAAMAARGPRAEVFTFAGVGHAPALIAADQIAAVRDWLTAP